ncbi:hypothetical protein NBZ79_15205 [Sneathiella marina]|uniref:Flagellar hook-length control protein-like C-terminal domain-containing protein n=1 Tax=Sneathiella marina TaxID=2950108 RepID=A0ABY4W3P5_9PROT|nr:hypothetical protein [Sneathiella marina]USG60512.1 hypothetical protein NBZ79_15205 [Sneathiella marina]
MSGIRSTSGVPPAVSSSGQASTSGPDQVTPVSPAQPAGGQTGLPVSSAPPTGSHSLEATLITAIVTAKTSGESVILHSEFGNFRLTTTVPLAVGSQITFEIDAVEDIILARLISKDGKPFSSPIDVRLLPIVNATTPGPENYIRAGQLHPLELKAGLQNLTTSLPAPELKTAAPPSKVSSTPAPTVVPSAIDRPAPSVTGGISPAAIPEVPARLSNLLAYVNAQPPRAADPSFTASTTAATQNSSARMYHMVSAELMPSLDKAAAVTRPEGLSPIKLQKIDLVIRSEQAMTNPVNRPDILRATVISVQAPPAAGEKQQVHLATPLGVISYSSKSPPAVGKTMEFAVADKIMAFPLAYTDIQQPGAREPLMRVMGDWQNLRQAMNVVAVQDPVLAQSVINAVIPQANSQLSSGLLFFMAALKLGSVEKWLGQDFKMALEASGRTALLRGLEEDFGTFSRLQSDSGGQDWKSLNFPFFDGQNLRQIRMFHRQNHAQDGTDDDTSSTRFVIELSLTQSGPLQLDGIFSPRQFDLILRSEQEIPSPMKQHILSLFTENMEISGLRGQLVFKKISPFPIDPLAEWETGVSTGDTG